VGVPSVRGFSKREAIRFGWITMWSYPGFFVLLLIVTGLIYVFPQALGALVGEDNFILSAFLALAAAFLQIIVGMGLIRISLQFASGEKGEFADLFACVPLFFKYLLGSILYGLIVMGGMILLIVPGIIWSIKYMFFSYFIVERGLGPVEALKQSGALTQGAKWNLFLFGLLLCGVNLLGALVLLIGLFATIPTTMVATAYAYRRLQS
jgi:uncharacterized membrane protein